VAGQDSAEVVERLGERAVAAHVKECPARLDTPQTPLGTGDVDDAAAPRAGRHLRWHITENDDTEGDRFELLATNRRTPPRRRSHRSLKTRWRVARPPPGPITVCMKILSSRSMSRDGSSSACIRRPSIISSTMTTLSSAVRSGLSCAVFSGPLRNRVRIRSRRPRRTRARGGPGWSPRSPGQAKLR